MLNVCGVYCVCSVASSARSSARAQDGHRGSVRGLRRGGGRRLLEAACRLLAACATLPVEVVTRRYCERQAVCYLVLYEYYHLSAGQAINQLGSTCHTLPRTKA